MSDTDSLDYLQSGFDPAALTVPRLRSILVSYNISYPASAKKPQLIQLLEEHVLPNSRKILNARARARRTSKGITNADRDEDSPIPDEELMPPPPSTVRSTRKSSSRAKVDDSESEAIARSPSRRTPRVSTRQSLAPETDQQDMESSRRSTSVRRTRKSEIPELSPPPIDNTAKISSPSKKIPVTDSAFSHDNPFQSGSPPSSELKPQSDERRRRTTGSESIVRRKSSTRRTTGGPIKSERTTYELPVSKLNGLIDTDDNGVTVSEEFTPEEQLELVRERSAKGVNAISRPTKRKVAKPINKTGPIMVALALFGGYGAWYRQEKLAVGYCGVGREAHPLVSVPSNINLPEWATVMIEPQCEPCPQHAYCYRNMDVTCEQDYILKSHPLSLGGLVPLVPICEPDGEKVRKVKMVADRAIEGLRERRAQYECGSLTDAAGSPASSVEIPAEELKRDMSQLRRKGMSEAEFEELWVGAMGEMKNREEVEMNIDGATQTVSLLSNSLARVPLSCSIRRSFRLTLARYRLQIALMIATFFASVYMYFKYTSYVAARAKVPLLVDMTLNRLSTQATLNIQDKEATPEPWISIGQLRDDVLRTEYSVKKREALWQKVRKIVEMNSNVRVSQKESRNGEIARVWEWIGAIANIDDGEGRRRKSGRVSFGAYADGSPVSGSDNGQEAVRAKWNESRPAF